MFLIWASMVMLAEVLSIAILDNNKEASHWFSFESPCA